MLKRRRAKTQPGRGEALTLQGENQGVGNGGFVFDYQDMGHGVRARQLSGRTVDQG
ncbi:hypothetical protein D3C86_1427730 [compost metagenome]